MVIVVASSTMRWPTRLERASRPVNALMKAGGRLRRDRDGRAVVLFDGPARAVRAGLAHLASRDAGLGLAIALENARLLGGDIDIWSEVGTGTRFTLRLPVTQPLPSGEGGVSRPGDD